MGALFKTTEYGTQANTYDLAKGIALAAMIVDHIGYYILPEQQWLRLVGRAAFPLFLFLVGYSGSRRFDGWLLAGAVLVLLNAGITGLPLFPLNILFSIALWRGFLLLGDRYPLVWHDLGILWVSLLLLYLPSMLLIEYGTLGLMYVCTGHLMRMGRQEDKSARLFLLSTVILTVAAQSTLFGFTLLHILAYAGLSVVLAAGMLHFRLQPLEQPEAQKSYMAKPATVGERLLILFARNTLPIYVLHVILLQWWAHIHTPERFKSGFQALFSIPL